jgi:hypothetical protein
MIEATTPESRLECDYYTGMFCDEPRPEGDECNPFACVDEMELVAFHEAGHAVAQYALVCGRR